MKRNVLVSGANGRTGSLVFQKLLNSSEFAPVALVRSEQSKKQLIDKFGDTAKVVVADLATVDEAQLRAAVLAALPTAVDKFVLCTSAVPAMNYWSLPKMLWSRLTGGKAMPEFTFPAHGSPYEVDWLGAKKQIDLAKALGVSQFVLLSSMGGTQPEHFLNTLGRTEGDERSGNILLWKRRSERYLVQSGLPFTVVHPGGLTDKRSATGKVTMGFNDELLKAAKRTISRDEVADVCVQALLHSDALNKSFDVVSVDEEKSDESCNNWSSLFATPGTNSYDDEDPVKHL